MAKRQSRSRREHSEESDSELVHKIPVDIVEVERNIIEKWLMSLRHYLSENASQARYFIISLISAGILALLLLFIHTFAVENHSYRFYKILGVLEETRMLPENTRKEVLGNVISDSMDLCNVFWKTSSSTNGCLLAATAAIELKDAKAEATALEAYSKKQSLGALKGFAIFYAGYAQENAGEYQKALEHYTKLEKEFKKSKHEDFAIFHTARMQLQLGKLDEAEKSFARIMTEFPDSNYSREVRKYRLLIQARRVTQK